MSEILAVVTEENCPVAWRLFKELTELIREGVNLQDSIQNKMGNDPEQFGQRHIEGYEGMSPLEQAMALAKTLESFHNKHRRTMIRLSRLRDIIDGDKAKLWIEIETTFGLDPCNNQHIKEFDDRLEIYSGKGDDE